MKSLYKFLLENKKQEIYDDRFSDVENKIINKLANGGRIEWDEDEHDAWEEMDKDTRELMLMVSGFTGLTNDDELEDVGTIYTAIDKKEMFTELIEQMVNYVTKYGMDDSYSYHILYNDNKIIHVSEDNFEYEFDDTKYNRGTSWKTAETLVKKLLKQRNIECILCQNGYGEPYYWCKDDFALARLQKYGGFEYWENGRGEKRRNYIQDDWI